MLALLLSPALACGGFFCDNVTPVEQTAERVLFQINDNGTITSFVEVQFEGPPSDFGWVVPIPHAIDADAVTVAPAGLFDHLERATSPRFVREVAMATEDTAGSSCSLRGRGERFDDAFFLDSELSGVEVVGSGVAGPYDVEIITAESGEELAAWLQWAGYQIPFSANGAMQHYIDGGMAFIGVRLVSDVPDGPLDTLSFTFDGDAPMVPIILTAHAAQPDMEIVTYVLGEQRFAPANYTDVAFAYDTVEWMGGDTTDYPTRALEATNTDGGHALITEFAGPVSGLTVSDPDLSDLLSGGRYLSRFRTFLSPEEMTVDPMWTPAPDLPDVSNVHALPGGAVEEAAIPLLATLALGLVLVRRFRPA